MPDLSIFRTILEGGFGVAILYAFYLLLSHTLRGIKSHEAVIEALQERYIDDLKSMQTRHDEQFDKERSIHREEIREISITFSNALQSVGDNLAKLTSELQILSLRIDGIYRQEGREIERL